MWFDSTRGEGKSWVHLGSRRVRLPAGVAILRYKPCLGPEGASSFLGRAKGLRLSGH